MNSTHPVQGAVEEIATIETIKSHVDNMLVQFCDEQIKLASQQSKQYALLWQTIKTVVLSGGKRLRPYLVYMGHQMFDGDSDILQIAAAHELLHISMLMHDDIIDRDYERHGILNVTGQYMKLYETKVSENDLTHYANSAALLAGDLLISSAYNLIASSSLEPAVMTKTLAILHDSIFTVVGGELHDVEASFITSTVGPLEIAHFKTAIYSCVNPLLTGAVIAGANSRDQSLLREFGTNLGIAFQLTDDLLGVFGSSTKTGKSTTSDLAEGKLTYMVEQTLAKASSTQLSEFNTLFGKHDLTEDEAEKLRGIIISSGARDSVYTCVSSYVEKAEDSLAELNKSGFNTTALSNLLLKISGRES